MDVNKKRMTEATGFSTRAVHAGERRDPVTGSIVTPIYQTSNFAAENTDALVDTMTERKEGYIYTRHGNPTTRAVEEKLAELEGVEDAEDILADIEQAFSKI
jgi:methionine-gamma-lyase